MRSAACNEIAQGLEVVQSTDNFQHSTPVVVDAESGESILSNSLNGGGHLITYKQCTEVLVRAIRAFNDS